MKARKTMKNQPLIQEVISQISQRFAPKIPDIKKVCICYIIDLYTQLFPLLCRQSTHYLRKSILSGSITLEIPLHTLRNSLIFFSLRCMFCSINLVFMVDTAVYLLLVIPFLSMAWFHFDLCLYSSQFSDWEVCCPTTYKTSIVG